MIYIKHFIIFLILSHISSKLAETTQIIEYDVETNFDENHFDFNFEIGEENIKYLFIQINSVDGSNINYSYECPSIGEDEGFTLLFTNFVIKIKKEICNIKLKTKSKGTIIIHPLDKEINIDFGESKYKIERAQADFNPPSLIYNVSNLNQDITAKFNFEKYIYINDKLFSFSNPFTVCENNSCEENVETYRFIKGNNYQIKLSFSVFKTEYGKYYQMPSLSFYKEESPDDKEVEEEKEETEETENKDTEEEKEEREDKEEEREDKDKEEEENSKEEEQIEEEEEEKDNKYNSSIKMKISFILFIIFIVF